MKIVKTKCGYMSKQKAVELGLLKKGYNMKNTKQTTKHKRSVAQHTGGEWKVTKGTNGFCDTWQVHIETPTRAMTIADCGAIVNKVFLGSTNSTPVMVENKEHEANARLIASAPLMLEALEAVEELNYRSNETDHNEVLIPVSVLEKVIQAIAKAKGK